MVDGHLLPRRDRGVGVLGGADPHGDFPDVATEFAPHGGIRRIAALFRPDPAQTRMEPDLSAPTNLTEGRFPGGEGSQPAFDGPVEARLEAVTMGGLDQHAPEMDIAGFGDVPAPLGDAGRRFGRDDTTKRHQPGGAGKLAQIASFRHERGGHHPLDAAGMRA